MKIAVLESLGATTDTAERVVRYYAVANTYDFGANAALDVTDTSTLILFLQINRFDYKVFRASLASYVGAVGFANLSDANKRIASQHFVVDFSDRITVHTIAEQKANGRGYHENSVGSRILRVRVAAAEIYNLLTKADRDVVITDIQSGGLRNLYVEYGREGTVEGDPAGLFDYVEARAGTTYETTGLAAKGYTPVSGTLAELVARIMDILKNGNY